MAVSGLNWAEVAASRSVCWWASASPPRSGSASPWAYPEAVLSGSGIRGQAYWSARGPAFASVLASALEPASGCVLVLECDSGAELPL
jgi:hypothetical protein